jgi:hypothetical protein
MKATWRGRKKTLATGQGKKGKTPARAFSL